MRLVVWGTDALEAAVRGAVTDVEVARSAGAADDEGVLLVAPGSEEEREATRRGLSCLRWDTGQGSALLRDLAQVLVAAERRALYRGVEIVELVAHDARNPIGAALTNLGFLAEGSGSWSDEVAEALSDTEQSVQRTRDVLDDGAALAKLLGSPRAVGTPVDLVKIVSDTAKALERPAGERKLRIVVDAPASAYGRADEALLRRAFVALAYEATRHAPRGADLVLAATETTDVAALRIEHDLSAERAPRLAALTAPVATRRPALAFLLARAVAAAHGGRFEATLDGRARIVLELPAR